MLTMTFRASMDSDPITKIHQEAVALLQLRDDRLSPEQKVIMFKKLTLIHALAQVYPAVTDEGLRRMWLQDICNE